LKRVKTLNTEISNIQPFDFEVEGEPGEKPLKQGREPTANSAPPPNYYYTLLQVKICNQYYGAYNRVYYGTYNRVYYGTYMYNRVYYGTYMYNRV
jgi:hypothetical protein